MVWWEQSSLPVLLLAGVPLGVAVLLVGIRDPRALIPVLLMGIVALPLLMLVGKLANLAPDILITRITRRFYQRFVAVFVESNWQGWISSIRRQFTHFNSRRGNLRRNLARSVPVQRNDGPVALHDLNRVQSRVGGCQRAVAQAAILAARARGYAPIKQNVKPRQRRCWSCQNPLRRFLQSRR